MLLCQHCLLCVIKIKTYVFFILNCIVPTILWTIYFKGRDFVCLWWKLIWAFLWSDGGKFSLRVCYPLCSEHEEQKNLYQQQEIKWEKSIETSKSPRIGIVSCYYKVSGSHQNFGACIWNPDGTTDGPDNGLGSEESSRWGNLSIEHSSG